MIQMIQTIQMIHIQPGERRESFFHPIVAAHGRGLRVVRAVLKSMFSSVVHGPAAKSYRRRGATRAVGPEEKGGWVWVLYHFVCLQRALLEDGDAEDRWGGGRWKSSCAGEERRVE
jgi:hypothetical protein